MIVLMDRTGLREARAAAREISGAPQGGAAVYHVREVDELHALTRGGTENLDMLRVIHLAKRELKGWVLPLEEARRVKITEPGTKTPQEARSRTRGEL